MSEQRPQRSRQYVDRDLMAIAMSQWGMSASKAANEIVSKVDNAEVADNAEGVRGVVLLRYGDITSPPGEAFLREFVDSIVERNPKVFNEELYARAQRGENVGRDEPLDHLSAKPSAEQVAKFRARFGGTF